MLLRIKGAVWFKPFLRASDAKLAILWQPHLMDSGEAESGKLQLQPLVLISEPQG